MKGSQRHTFSLGREDFPRFSHRQKLLFMLTRLPLSRELAALSCVLDVFFGLLHVAAPRL